MGGAKLITLLQQFGGIDSLVRETAPALGRAGLDPATIHALQHPDETLLASDLQWLGQAPHDLITWDSERYPALLREISSPPAALFADGDMECLWQPQLAIVGSRNPTAGGFENARDFSYALSQQGLTISSGLASGIDSAAHAAALDAGGKTVAVAGTGLDRTYPAGNRFLAERIRGQGVIVSEFPPGTAAAKSHFPSRNRIISGLSLGVLVVEAGLNSGSLITARLAAEQGREVFALPGSIHNPMAKGCHRLIREGVRLVETVEQILEELAPLAGQLASNLQVAPSIGCGTDWGTDLDKPGQDPKLASDPDYRKLWKCLGHDPVPADSLIRASGLTAKAVSAMLLLLELRGKVEAHPGGAFSRKK